MGKITLNSKKLRGFCCKLGHNDPKFKLVLTECHKKIICFPSVDGKYPCSEWKNSERKEVVYTLKTDLLNKDLDFTESYTSQGCKIKTLRTGLGFLIIL